MARPRRSPWPLAWLAIANGWSNERLAAEYLRCWDRPLDGRLDVFTSFRSMDDGHGGCGGESERLVVESPWSQLTSECQCFGHPPRLDK